MLLVGAVLGRSCCLQRQAPLLPLPHFSSPSLTLSNQQLTNNLLLKIWPTRSGQSLLQQHLRCRSLHFLRLSRLPRGGGGSALSPHRTFADKVLTASAFLQEHSCNTTLMTSFSKRVTGTLITEDKANTCSWFWGSDGNTFFIYNFSFQSKVKRRCC